MTWNYRVIDDQTDVRMKNMRNTLVLIPQENDGLPFKVDELVGVLTGPLLRYYQVSAI